METGAKKGHHSKLLKIPRMLFAAGYLLLWTLRASAEPSPSNAKEFTRADIEAKIAGLQKMRAENPELFRQVVESRKSHIKSQLQEIHLKNPEKFESLKQHILQLRRQRLQELRRQDPQEFRKRMQQRVEQLRQWRAANPERFQRFLQEHPVLAQRIQRAEVFSENKPRRQSERMAGPQRRNQEFWNREQEIRQQERQMYGGRGVRGRTAKRNW